MDRTRWLVLRGTGVIAAGVLVAAGVAFAQRGGGPERAAQPLEATRVATTGASLTSPTAAFSPSTLAVATTSPPAPTETSTAVPTAIRTFSPTSGAVVPIAAPNPTSTPGTGALPVSDIPKYTDVAVLALAADAVLPSGMTFRECMELPPSHEKWPTPVHLYYEGNGRWLVETHVSEVQVAFDEVTATFTPRNFAPTNPACR